MTAIEREHIVSLRTRSASRCKSRVNAVDYRLRNTKCAIPPFVTRGRISDYKYARFVLEQIADFIRA